MLTVSLVNYRRLNSGKMQKVETVGNKKKKMGNESGTISHVFKKKAGLRDLRIPGICIVPTGVENRLDLVYVKPRQLHVFWLLIVGAGVGGFASLIDS